MRFAADDAGEIRAAAIGLAEIRFLQDGALEPGRARQCPDEGGAGQVGAGQVGLDEIGSVEMRAGQAEAAMPAVPPWGSRLAGRDARQQLLAPGPEAGQGEPVLIRAERTPVRFRDPGQKPIGGGMRMGGVASGHGLSRVPPAPARHSAGPRRGHR